MRLSQGTIRLFRFAQVDVFLHWSWFLIAAFEINARSKTYNSLMWNALEYLALFVIVLVHEYGHALACRSVGGIANRIVLWPLGGVAYVDPPARPGATLWSIAAGPLVNVVLAPVLYVTALTFRNLGWAAAMPDAYALLRSIWIVNLILLIFNLLPIYPLDGGQILRSLLWFLFGRGRSLMIATIFGFVGVLGLVAFAFYAQSMWIGLIAVFTLMNCWSGLQQARALLQVAKLPRRDGYACPSCQSAPPVGPFWKCNNCNTAFDTFETQAKCPQCAATFPTTTCLDCRRQSTFLAWVPGATVVTNP